MIVAYVSGHGFGHAVRTAEVLRAVRERAPELPVTVVTSGAAGRFREAIPGPLQMRSLQCDVGLAQKDALVIDEAGTVALWEAFAAGYEALVRGESAWLRGAGARVVLGDIPPLAFAAAAGAGVPGVALANFSWDWIYRHLSARHPALTRAADQAGADYGRATLLLRLPFAGDLSVFPRIEDIPLVARRPRVERAECRRRLELTGGPVVLLSFGGLGLPGFDPAVLAPLQDLRFLTNGEWPRLPSNVKAIGPDRLIALGLRYEDLVGAADVVVTKPGYGIVSDAIGARTRLVYTDRGDFPEYPILVREMSRYLPCAYVSNEDLLAGRLAEPVRAVQGQPMPAPPDLSGAEVAASRLLQLAAH